MLSVHGDRQHVRATIRAGASGYLIKGADRAALADAVRTVHAGEQALTQELAFIISPWLNCRLTLACSELYHDLLTFSHTRSVP